MRRSNIDIDIDTGIDIGQPADYGLPPKFNSWRQAQRLGLERVYQEVQTGTTPPRFRGVQMIVGSGKTGYYMTVDRIRKSLIQGHRTVILTMFKPLQQQIMEEFQGHVALHDIRGRANYSCRNWDDCDIGAEHNCSLSRSTHCEYRASYERALRSSVVVTNPAYWMSIHKYGEGLGNFDLMIVDEAHSLFQVLSEAATVKMKPDVGPQGEFGRLRLDLWKQYAEERKPQCELEMQTATGWKAKALRNEMNALLVILHEAEKDGFTVDVDPNSGWAQISPIWPADSADRNFYLGIPEVILVSGTLTARTMQMIGAAGPSIDSVFETYPPSIDPSTWPVHLTDVGHIKSNMGVDVAGRWKAAHNMILRHHRDLKGMDHSVSYTRANEIAGFLDATHHRVMTHPPGKVDQAVEDYKAARMPTVMVTPAMTTGYDFPEEPVNFSIISKMPVPDFRSVPNLRKARQGRYREYGSFEMMNVFCQSLGRMKRSPEQVSHIYVLDSFARPMLHQHMGELVPEWVDSLLVWGDKGKWEPDLRRP